MCAVSCYYSQLVPATWVQHCYHAGFIYTYHFWYSKVKAHRQLFYGLMRTKRAQAWTFEHSSSSKLKLTQLSNACGADEHSNVIVLLGDTEVRECRG